MHLAAQGAIGGSAPKRSLGLGRILSRSRSRTARRTGAPRTAAARLSASRSAFFALRSSSSAAAARRRARARAGPVPDRRGSRRRSTARRRRSRRHSRRAARHRCPPRNVRRTAVRGWLLEREIAQLPEARAAARRPDARARGPCVYVCERVVRGVARLPNRAIVVSEAVGDVGENCSS